MDLEVKGWRSGPSVISRQQHRGPHTRKHCRRDPGIEWGGCVGNSTSRSRTQAVWHGGGPVCKLIERLGLCGQPGLRHANNLTREGNLCEESKRTDQGWTDVLARVCTAGDLSEGTGRPDRLPDTTRAFRTTRTQMVTWIRWKNTINWLNRQLGNSDSRGTPVYITQKSRVILSGQLF